LINQQISNDPGGRRWAGLADDAVDMFLVYHGKRSTGAAKEKR